MTLIKHQGPGNSVREDLEAEVTLLCCSRGDIQCGNLIFRLEKWDTFNTVKNNNNNKQSSQGKRLKHRSRTLEPTLHMTALSVNM